MDAIPCPLCGGPDTSEVCRDAQRAFVLCAGCRLVFVPCAYHVTADQEKRRYDLHQNRPDDAGYRAFLGQLVERLVPRLAPGARGLDFGSGPGPTLSAMLGERGFPTLDYDLYYADCRERLETAYDFVTCTETVEHFRDPRAGWETLVRLVKPRGWLGIMTRLQPANVSLATWDYANDRTHVCFHARETFEWLAARHGLTAEFFGNSVTLLQKV
jgi:SAM-dependent methyltransferase